MTHPQDRLLLQDFLLCGLFLILGMMFFAGLDMSVTVEPVEHCANMINQSLSPYQVHRLTGAEFPDLPRDEVLSWCSTHVTDWERSIESARLLPEFPHHLDMLID